MALMTWSEQFSVKIKKIDEQHHHLVDLINTLHDAMKTGQGKAALEKILAELVEYTKNHFADEEQLMKTHGYPGFLMHKIEHDKLTGKVLALQEDMENGKPVLSMSVMQFLKDWLLNHIQGTDKLYSGFLNGKGVV